MKKESKQWAWDMYRTLENVAERIDNNTLSEKDASDTANMLLQLDHEVRNDPDYHTDSSVPAISVSLNELYDALNNKDVKLLRLDNDIFRQVLTFGEVIITQEERDSMPVKREDGRTYIDWFSHMPYEQYTQLVHNMEKIGAKYDPEAKLWYVEEDWEPKQVQEGPSQENKDTEKTESHDMDENRRFKAVYYDNSERKEVFSSSKTEAIDTIRRLMEPEPVSQFIDGKKLTGKERCYIQERDASGQYQQEGIYLIASGREVKPASVHAKDENRRFKAVYYDNSERKEIFSSSKDEAIDTVRRLMEPEPVSRFVDGKKLTGKERCYIQKRDANGQYQQEGIYLIASGKEVKPASVHAKLEQNKRAAFAGNKDSDKERSVEARKREERTV